MPSSAQTNDRMSICFLLADLTARGLPELLGFLFGERAESLDLVGKQSNIELVNHND